MKVDVCEIDGLYGRDEGTGISSPNCHHQELL